LSEVLKKKSIGSEARKPVALAFSQKVVFAHPFSLFNAAEFA
jgi:hypothetical protein